MKNFCTLFFGGLLVIAGAAGLCTLILSLNMVHDVSGERRTGSYHVQIDVFDAAERGKTLNGALKELPSEVIASSVRSAANNYADAVGINPNAPLTIPTILYIEISVDNKIVSINGYN